MLSDRSQRLRTDLAKRLHSLANTPESLANTQVASRIPPDVANLQSTGTWFQPQSTAAPTAYPPIRNEAPVEILTAWTSLEVLSPATFKRPDDLSSTESTLTSGNLRVCDRCRVVHGGRSVQSLRQTQQVASMRKVPAKVCRLSTGPACDDRTRLQQGRRSARCMSVQPRCVGESPRSHAGPRRQ